MTTPIPPLVASRGGAEATIGQVHRPPRLVLASVATRLLAPALGELGLGRGGRWQPGGLMMRVGGSGSILGKEARLMQTWNLSKKLHRQDYSGENFT